MMVPVVPVLETKWVMVPRCRPDFRAGAVKVRLWIVRVAMTDPEAPFARLRRRASSAGIDADAGVSTTSAP